MRRILRVHAPAVAVIGAAALLGIAGASPQARRPVRNEPAIRYNRDIRPILAENCFACHGPDSGTRKANLRLDTEAGSRADRGGRAALVPGDLKRSALVSRVTAGNSPLVMPPASTGKKLTPREIDLLKRWVAQGGKYEIHWAYQPIVRPAVPAIHSPKSKVQNPIDRFILARLRKEGLSPSPEADLRTLIRRVSLDLTGLPPKPEEVRAFLADRRPDAYERVVDKYLASPRFGERMAVYWLDLVRYADTVGYHGDQDVSVWPYRDYVIKSFNENKPFDQFTREQLAGDLLPEKTQEQRVASAYNRLGMMSTEGGVQDKEYRAKYAAERIRNLSGAWLGSTIGCAECHDHKFDPFSTRDFYALQAFFADIKEKGFYDGGFGNGDWGPTTKLMTPEQRAQIVSLNRAIADAKKSLAAVTDDSLAQGRAQWEARTRALDAAKALDWKVLKPVEAKSDAGSPMTIQADGVVFVGGEPAAEEVYEVKVAVPRGRLTAIKLEPHGDERLPGNGIGRSGYCFALTEFQADLRRGDKPDLLFFGDASVNIEEEGYPVRAAIDFRPETAWAPGINARSSGQPAIFHLEAPLELAGTEHLTIYLRFQTRARLSLGKFRLLASSVDRPTFDAQGLPVSVLAAIRKETAQRTPQETAAIAAHYRTLAPELGQRTMLAFYEAQRSLILGNLPQTLVTETVDPRPIRILPRGNWMDDSGEIVAPATPHFLEQLRKEGRANRLDLASWVASPKNPLTARVFVNRLWHLFFGVGLSKNVVDFGIQGEPPIHPELLDWLAAEFMTGDGRRVTEDHGRVKGDRSDRLRPLYDRSVSRGGDRWTEKSNLRGFQPSSVSRHPSHTWDIKHIIRLIVTSQTYRQSSVARPELLARDPYNRLYARQSAPRLDAEFIRDVALSAAGMLDDRIGGPSVKPYQPRGYLASLNFPRREWDTGAGKDLYRRGIYTFWQRQYLHPSLLAFDAATREECTSARVVSNTPMQSLTLMNDPIYVEASRVLAERVLREAEPTYGRRIAVAFERVLARPPAAKEEVVLKRLYDRSVKRYRADVSSARKAISEGEWPLAKDLDPAELAAWTMVCRAILNLHETITRG